MSLRLLSYNIQLGGAGREKPLAAVINACQPDVVVLQEATRPEVVDRLAEACAMKARGAVRGNSVAFLSRIEIAQTKWRQPKLAKRSYLELALAGWDLRIFDVHLSAIHSNLTETRRAYELGSILGAIAQQPKGFHLIVGDFNTLAPGERLDVGQLPARLRAIVWLTGGTIRWRTIRLMLDAGYVDGYRGLHKDDPGFSFPARDPHIRLDYVFLPAAFASRLTRCEVVRDAPGIREASDHFPLLSEISAQ